MAHACPAPQPALKGGEIGPARERPPPPPRPLPVPNRPNAASAVEQGEIGLLFRQTGRRLPSATRIVRPTPQPSRFSIPNSATCRTTSDGGTPAASWP